MGGGYDIDFRIGIVVALLAVLPPPQCSVYLLSWFRSYHGDVPSNERAKNLVAFREGRCPLLVATDIAARGYA